jgi:hypothetical protein
MSLEEKDFTLPRNCSACLLAAAVAAFDGGAPDIVVVPELNSDPQEILIVLYVDRERS